MRVRYSYAQSYTIRSALCLVGDFKKGNRRQPGELHFIPSLNCVLGCRQSPVRMCTESEREGTRALGGILCNMPCPMSVPWGEVVQKGSSSSSGKLVVCDLDLCIFKYKSEVAW